MNKRPYEHLRNLLPSKKAKVNQNPNSKNSEDISTKKNGILTVNIEEEKRQKTLSKMLENEAIAIQNISETSFIDTPFGKFKVYGKSVWINLRSYVRY